MNELCFDGLGLEFDMNTNPKTNTDANSNANTNPSPAVSCSSNQADKEDLSSSFSPFSPESAFSPDSLFINGLTDEFATNNINNHSASPDSFGEENSMASPVSSPPTVKMPSPEIQCDSQTLLQQSPTSKDEEAALDELFSVAGAKPSSPPVSPKNNLSSPSSSGENGIKPYSLRKLPYSFFTQPPVPSPHDISRTRSGSFCSMNAPQSTVRPPPPNYVSHQRRRSSLALPPGWEAVASSKGLTYFVNHNNNTSTWLDPRIPPPPSPCSSTKTRSGSICGSISENEPVSPISPYPRSRRNTIITSPRPSFDASFAPTLLPPSMSPSTTGANLLPNSVKDTDLFSEEALQLSLEDQDGVPELPTLQRGRKRSLVESNSEMNWLFDEHDQHSPSGKRRKSSVDLELPFHDDTLPSDLSVLNDEFISSLLVTASG